MKSLLLPVCLLLMVWGTACQKENSNSRQIADSDSLEIETPIDPLLQCLEVSDQICSAGIWFAILGEQINNLPLEDLQPKSIADSSLTEAGYSYVKRTVYLESGEVVIEGTFMEENRATEEDLNNSKVHRLFFRSPEFRTMSGLRVGDPLRKVLETYDSQNLIVSSIPDYETIVIQLPEPGNMYLHFTDPANLIANTAGEGLSVESLPDSWQVREIVVM